MDGQRDQRTDGQQDEAYTFSMKIGSDQPQPDQESHLMPGPSAIVPPPLTPAPQTPTPQTPQTPATQGAPASYPPQPHYPPYAQNPQYSQYPPQPAYPQQPAHPQYPQYSQYPQQYQPFPTPSQAPASMPLSQATGGYGQHSTPYPPQSPMAPITPVTPVARGPLGRPFSAPQSLLVVLGSAVILALVFAVRVVLLGGDWSDGALAVGIAALALAAVTIVVTLMRVAAGRRSVVFALLSLVLLVALAVTGAAGLIASPSLHHVQAQVLEQNGQWGAAIREYTLIGEKGPNAPDIARVETAWGEQLLAQHNYHGALQHFQTVLDDYSKSGDAVTRAMKGQVLAYAAWLQNDPTTVPYRDAIDALANYTPGSDCASDCQATLAQAAAQAYYLYGVQLMSQKQYSKAIAEFTKLISNYGSSTYAKQAHGKTATALFAYGQQQISSQDCSGAVSSYSSLIATYKDTPEAPRARAALDAPQNVTGFIANAPTNPSPDVHLSKHMDFNAFFFSDEYTTTLDPKTGAFTFKNVSQGTYFLSTSRPVAGGVDYGAWWADSSHTAFFSFTVTPLCPTQLGTFH